MLDMVADIKKGDHVLISGAEGSPVDNRLCEVERAYGSTLVVKYPEQEPIPYNSLLQRHIKYGLAKSQWEEGHLIEVDRKYCSIPLPVGDEDTYLKGLNKLNDVYDDYDRSRGTSASELNGMFGALEDVPKPHTSEDEESEPIPAFVSQHQIDLVRGLLGAMIKRGDIDDTSSMDFDRIEYLARECHDVFKTYNKRVMDIDSEWCEYADDNYGESD